MIKLLILAVAIYFAVSLAARLSDRMPLCIKAAAPVVDAGYEKADDVVDAQFSHVPAAGEKPFMLAMIDGRLYCSSGRESEAEGHCGVMDGSIESSVESDRIPSQEGQSNFGAPYGYQYGADGRIEINVGPRWVIFEPVQGRTRN